MVRAANCSFNNNLLGTMTSASTVQRGARSLPATLTRHCSGSRMGFSSPITMAGANFLTEFQQAVIGVGPQNESDAAGRQFLREVRNPFDQETIVPEIGTRIERNGRKKNYNWLLQFVGDLNGHIQSRIVVGALRPLHPVDDAVPSRTGRTWRPHRDPLILTELFDRVHDCESVD